MSFLFAHRRGYGVIPAAGRGTFPPSADGESPAEVQRKTSRPLGANTLTLFAHPVGSVQKRSRPSGRTRLRQFACPGQPVQKKELPVRGEPACGSSSAPVSWCRKGAAPSGRTRLRQFAHPGFPVQKRSRPSGANTLTQFACPGQPVQKIREIPKKFSRPKRQQKRLFSRRENVYPNGIVSKT